MSSSMTLMDRFNDFKSFYLYGATPAAAATCELLAQKGKEIVGFVDRDPKKQLQPFLERSVISPDTFLQGTDVDTGVVIVSAHQMEIARFLEKENVDSERIFPHLDAMFFPTYQTDFRDCETLDRLAAGLKSDEERQFLASWRKFKSTGCLAHLEPMPSMQRQYAHKAWLADINPGGIALDIGAFDGVTSVDLAQSRLFSKVVAFEPFRENFELLVNTASQKDLAVPVEVRQLALGAGRQTLVQAKEGVSSRSRITKETNQPIESGETLQIHALDEFSFGNVSLAKVDIEGFELDFLEGARCTIARERPHVAISAYHHASHPRRVAEFFYDSFDGVQIRVGHHPLAVYELEYYVSFND